MKNKYDSGIDESLKQLDELLTIYKNHEREYKLETEGRIVEDGFLILTGDPTKPIY